MRGIGGIDPGWGIIPVRLAMAAVFLVAGFGKFSNLEGVSGFLGKIGIPLAGAMGPFLAVLEFGGGILLLVGLAARWVGLLFALEFIVAAFYYKLPTVGFQAGRIDLMLLAGAILIFIAGAGKASIDEVWLEKDTS